VDLGGLETFLSVVVEFPDGSRAFNLGREGFSENIKGVGDK